MGSCVTFIVITACCLLSFIVTICVGQQSIECYVCNSEYDPHCSDPFNDYSIASINCSWREVPENVQGRTATFCRKTVQNIQGRTRIVRACGYVADPHFDNRCVVRAGTHEIQVTYCSCDSPKCNEASRFVQLPSMTLFAAMAGLGRLLSVI